MNRCLIFMASLFFAFLAIASATTAGAAEWKRAAFSSAPSRTFRHDDGGGNIASWATIRTPRLFALVMIPL